MNMKFTSYVIWFVVVCWSYLGHICTGAYVSQKQDLKQDTYVTNMKLISITYDIHTSVYLLHILIICYLNQL